MLKKIINNTEDLSSANLRQVDARVSGQNFLDKKGNKILPGLKVII